MKPPECFLCSSRLDLAPKYSPDGKHVAFSSNRTGGHGIWMCDADGSNVMEVFTQAGINAGSASWSPNGQSLVFDSTTEGVSAIYVVRVIGEKPARLTNNPEGDLTASWSNDGNWIYFTSIRNQQHQIWKFPAKGGTPIQVIANGGVWPVQSRDGKWLYFQESGKLFKAPVDGGESIQILPSVSNDNFDIVDDGIYFITRPDENNKVYLQFLGFADNTVKTIAELPRQISQGFTVSPDRRFALYTNQDKADSDLMLVENFR